MAAWQAASLPDEHGVQPDRLAGCLAGRVAGKFPKWQVAQITIKIGISWHDTQKFPLRGRGKVIRKDEFVVF